MPRRDVIIGLVILLIFGGVFVSMFIEGHRNDHRTLVSMVLSEFRNNAEQLEIYELEHGGYPPLSKSGPIYTYVSDSLTSPLAAFSMGFIASKRYIGPPLDPYRDERIFTNEVRGKVRYTGGKDGGGIYPYWKGYPPRYFRNSAGDFFVLLSNGPDRDEDVTLRVLDEITSPTLENFVGHAVNHIYDATNGSNSNGDLFRGSW